MPDTIRFLLIIACLAGAVYGAVWALSNYPPEQTQIVRPLRLAHVVIEQKMRKVRFSQIVMTVLGGALVGALVTLTSVGAGALIAVMLALIYPLRLDAKTIVGTDIIHAIPLTLVAALDDLSPWPARPAR